MARSGSNAVADIGGGLGKFTELRQRLLFVLGGWTDGAVARRRVLVFLVIFVAQGAIGGIQALIGIPEVRKSFDHPEA